MLKAKEVRGLSVKEINERLREEEEQRGCGTDVDREPPCDGTHSEPSLIFPLLCFATTGAIQVVIR